MQAKRPREEEEPAVQALKKKCDQQNCRGVPYFNFPGLKEGRFCRKHKLDGMEKVGVG